MENQETDLKSVRRIQGQKAGVSRQHTITFRCDLKNYEWLQGVGNKGRYINTLIQKDRIKRLSVKE